MANNKETTPLMYNLREIDLIKSLFAENDALLIMMRKLFFGVELSVEEKRIIFSTFQDQDAVNVVRRKMHGVNDFARSEVGTLPDFWLGTEKQISGQPIDTIRQVMESKLLIKDMFEKGIALLTNPDGEKVNVEYVHDQEDYLGVKLIARNLYMMAVETTLHNLKIIAGIKEESAEDAEKRLKQDSAK